MSQQALLRSIAETLDRLGIEYMLSGSIVSSLQGEPRATHDVDIVVELSARDVPGLVAALGAPGMYLDEGAARAAVARLGMFNLIDTRSGDKVDFWPLTGSAYDRSRFSRRSRVEVFGYEVPVSSPEDTILIKLSWGARAGGSEKQHADALAVFEVQAGTLDLSYLKSWARELDVSDELERLIAEAEPLQG